MAVTTATALAIGSAFDLSGRAKFRVTGTDRVRFLNGQVTNDVRKATASRAIQACVLSAKGKIDAHVFISVADDAFLLDTDAELRAALPERFERYIIADDVAIEDISDLFSIVHVIGPVEIDGFQAHRTVEANRFAVAGRDFWFKRDEYETFAERGSHQLRFYNSAAAEELRIERGLPRWGYELTNEILPQEANLEADCVDYVKGCYIGQEVISRIKMSGQTNKRLCGVDSGDALLQPGMKLRAPSSDDREVGWITSAVFSKTLGKNIALGYVKRGFNSPGALLEAISADASPGATTTQVRTVPLPFGNTEAEEIDPRAADH
jgi:folate-binding protein YgfZ